MGKLIDGDELIELLLSTAITDKQREYSECVQYAVEKMPTVDAVPVRHGSWIGGEIGQCSVCGYTGCASDIWNTGDIMFCPNCGANMRKDGERWED